LKVPSRTLQGLLDRVREHADEHGIGYCPAFVAASCATWAGLRSSGLKAGSKPSRGPPGFRVVQALHYVYWRYVIYSNFD
jgi:hypothetical protein